MNKYIYLTIDDCPSKDFKEKIDFLYKYKIKAILFCIGHLVEKRQDEIIYAIKKGFIIGNHSYNHPFFSVISLKRACEEIKRTDDIIEQVYKKANVKRPIKLFRFPYGDKGKNLLFNKKDKLQNFLNSLGYKQPTFHNVNYPYFIKYGLDKDKDVFWTYDFQEYTISDLKKIFSDIEKGKGKKSGNLMKDKYEDIVLIHDHDNTKLAFFSIMKRLIDMRIKFKLPELK